MYNSFEKNICVLYAADSSAPTNGSPIQPLQAHDTIREMRSALPKNVANCEKQYHNITINITLPLIYVTIEIIKK